MPTTTRYLIRATWLSVFLCVVIASHTLAGSDDGRLVINEVENGFDLTVPLSRLILSMPKGGLAIGTNKRGGATESTRYFNLANAAEGGRRRTHWSWREAVHWSAAFRRRRQS